MRYCYDAKVDFIEIILHFSDPLLDTMQAVEHAAKPSFFFAINHTIKSLKKLKVLS